MRNAGIGGHSRDMGKLSTKYLQSDKPPPPPPPPSSRPGRRPASAPKKSSTPNLPSAALAFITFIIFVQDPVYPVFDQNSDVQGLGAADSYFGSPTLKLQTPSSSRLASSYANNALLYQSITTFAGTNFRSSTTTSKVPDSRGFGSSTGWVAGFNFDFQKSQLNRS